MHVQADLVSSQRLRDVPVPMIRTPLFEAVTIT